MIYILIMTIIFKGYEHSAISTTEFSSEQSCRYAGAQQELTLRNDLKIKTHEHYTFICVPK